MGDWISPTLPCPSMIKVTDNDKKGIFSNNDRQSAGVECRNQGAFSKRSRRRHRGKVKEICLQSRYILDDPIIGPPSQGRSRRMLVNGCLQMNFCSLALKLVSHGPPYLTEQDAVEANFA